MIQHAKHDMLIFTTKFLAHLENTPKLKQFLLNQNEGAEMNMEKASLIELLRTEARSGKNVRDLVKIVQDQNEPDDLNSFTVMGFFMKAFNLTISQVREMSGAECLGGGAYTNDEINKIIMPHIQNALNFPLSTGKS